MIDKSTPVWATVVKVGGVDAEGKPATATRCKHCSHTPSASAWRFAHCPRCGYRGGSNPARTTVQGTLGAPPANSSPVYRPTSTPVPPPMTEGEKVFAERIQELTKAVKGGK